MNFYSVETIYKTIEYINLNHVIRVKNDGGILEFYFVDGSLTEVYEDSIEPLEEMLFPEVIR